METEFIAIPTVKEGLKLSDKSRLDTKIKNANKKSFALSLEKVTLVTNAIQWLKSDEGQRELNEIGLHWTQEDLAEIIGGAFVIIDGRKISFKVDCNMDIVCRNADNIELVKSFINGVCERHTNNN